MSKQSVDRRAFLATGAIAGAAATLPAKSYARIAGANGKIGVGFLGVGGRCQQHIDVILKMQELGKAVAPVAVCDVWDGQVVPNLIKGRGLYPSAERCKLNVNDKEHVTKDYRKVLESKDVDAVCIATPDHWHARMAIDAMEHGKDVYMEKPMTRTIPEAIAVVDAAAKHNRVVTVGVQSMADPTWLAAHEYIRTGNIGHVLQGQTSYFRNSSVGQWRYYPLTKECLPRRSTGIPGSVINSRASMGSPWDRRRRKYRFDRAIWAQWRCYWPFGGGMFTDLFVHQTTHMIAAMGLKFPARVVGAGGLYMEYDTRDVPDVATVVADYEEGCQFIVSATMCNDVQLGEMIRGHLATIKFNGGGDFISGFEVYGQNIAGGPAKPKSTDGKEKPVFTYENPKTAHKDKQGLEDSATYALWENFLECVAKKNRETLSTPELGCGCFQHREHGRPELSLWQGTLLGQGSPRSQEADASWASRWEARSKKRGKPNQIAGWTAGEKGSLLEAPGYQKLEGPWVNGQDPAGS